MAHELICTWLGLPQGQWPPDHYRLLGVEPAEADADRIEQQVHQRLEVVRRYQLLHPDLVTEAMNRLAQAYICLTDPEARRAYDATRSVTSSLTEPAPAPPSADAHLPATPVPVTVIPVPLGSAAQRISIPSPPTAMPLSVSETPPVQEVTPPLSGDTQPVAIPLESREPTVTEPKLDSTSSSEPLPAESAASAVPAALAIPPVLEAVGAFSVARRGLGTRRALYHRLAATRRLQRAWGRVGRYLSIPSRRLTRPSEATDLINGLESVRTALDRFPPVLGNAGQPGYAVVILARQATPVPIFQTLVPSQRETLAQHWQSGQDLLRAYRQYLHHEMQSLRRKGLPGRAWQAARVSLRDQLVPLLLLLLALIALSVTIIGIFNEKK
jgi:hypothetical protein